MTTPRMPFGKYKDKPLSELPDAYLEWLLGLDNLRAALRTDLQAECERRQGPPPDPGSLLDLVNAGYRALAQRYHPDHGGDPAAMRETIRSAEFLRAMVKELSPLRSA